MVLEDIYHIPRASEAGIERIHNKNQFFFFTQVIEHHSFKQDTGKTAGTRGMTVVSNDVFLYLA